MLVCIFAKLPTCPQRSNKVICWWTEWGSSLCIRSFFGLFKESRSLPHLLNIGILLYNGYGKGCFRPSCQALTRCGQLLRVEKRCRASCRVQPGTTSNMGCACVHLCALYLLHEIALCCVALLRLLLGLGLG